MQQYEVDDEVTMEGYANQIDLNAGDRVRIRECAIGKSRLHYQAFEGTLLDDAGASEGWDVVDVKKDDGTIQSIYCFSIIREE